MEPITTTAAITGVVTYLAGKLAENKSINSFFDDFTEATINWIKPIFIKEDGTPTKVIADLSVNPSSAARLEAVKNSIAIKLEDTPGAEALLLEMLKVIAERQPSIIQGSNITQHHSGSGDNVGGDKHIHHK